jgi:hypothetical protein
MGECAKATIFGDLLERGREGKQVERGTSRRLTVGTDAIDLGTVCPHRYSDAEQSCGVPNSICFTWLHGKLMRPLPSLVPPR